MAGADVARDEAGAPHPTHVAAHLRAAESNASDRGSSAQDVASTVDPAAAPAASPSDAQACLAAPPMWRSSFPAMGTRVDIIGWGGDGMSIVNAVVEVVARHEDMWSVFRPTSEISRLNASFDDAHLDETPLPARAFSDVIDNVSSSPTRIPAAHADVGENTNVADTAVDCPPPSHDGDARAQAGPGLVVSEETDRLLRCSLVLAEATGGAFNPLIGPLVAAWDVKSMRAAYVAGSPMPPAPDTTAIQAAMTASSLECLTRIGERRWALRAPIADVDPAREGGTGLFLRHPRAARARADSEARSVDTRHEQDDRVSSRVFGSAIDSDTGASTAPSSPTSSDKLSRPRVDLGGIAKGYTADACRDLAVSLGARGVLVSVGTSSVSVYGTRSDGTPWRAGMRDPNGSPTRVADVVELPADGMASLSSSGDNLGPLGGLVRRGDRDGGGGESAGVDTAGAPAPEASVESAPASRVVGDAPTTSEAAGSGITAFAAPREPSLAALTDGLVFASGARETLRETSERGTRLLTHHIIDPRTGYSARSGVRQVSVVATSGVLAEALSTALLVDPSIDVADVAARWSRESGTPASARVVSLVGAAQG